MKKREVVKSNTLFNDIIQKGIKVSNHLFSIFYMHSEKEKPLFGISAPKKLGNAVVRNRVKRQLREVIDQKKMLFPKYQNYIIIVKERFLSASYEEKLEGLEKLIGEVHEEK